MSENTLMALIFVTAFASCSACSVANKWAAVEIAKIEAQKDKETSEVRDE